jgi:hypothetical protein
VTISADTLLGIGLGDVTVDGFADALYVRGDSSGASLEIVEADAAGFPFGRSIPLTIVDGTAVEIETADFNEDGVADVLLWQPGQTGLQLMVSNP